MATRRPLINAAATAIMVLSSGVGFAPQIAAQQQAQTVQANPISGTAANNWATQCSSDNRSGPFLCTMSQRIFSSENRGLLGQFTLNIGSGDEGTPTMVIQLPLGTAVQQGVALEIDGVGVGNYPIQTCEAVGCLSSQVAEPELIEQLKRGSGLVAQIGNLQGVVISIPFSLDGFTRAYEKID